MAGADRFSFLGREFLTWLWFEAERNGGRVDVGDQTYGVEFAQKLVLESGGTLREGSTVQAEAPSQAEEARTALRVGKKVARARLVLSLGERQFSFNLDAETMAISNAKLPTELGVRDAAGLDERVALLDQLEAAVDGLYVAFVRMRSHEATWGPVRDAMRGWVSTPVEA